MTPRRATLAFLVLVLLALVRIVSTYRHVAQTVDETPNIACGMQWLDQGRYDMGPFHPPLARIAVALGPYLKGLRSTGNPDRWKEGNLILHSRGRYERNLTAARLGTLPFFLLACLCLWLWGRHLLGEWGALAAVFLFTNTPIILAHAGLATTDMAVAAGILCALYRAFRWLAEPSARNAVLLGLGTALALLAKFSSFLIVPVCGLALLVAYSIHHRHLPKLKTLALAGLIAFLLVWAGYRFSVGTLQEPLNSGLADRSAFWKTLSHVPLPAPLLWDGMLLVKGLHADGHTAYLLGEIRDTGWWYFFPVALGVKTPLPILILALTGLVSLFRKPNWASLAPALCAGLILAACLPSHLNTGLRYILCIFPFLALLAAQGIEFLWRFNGTRCLGLALLIWLSVVNFRTHPDYLPYFNLLAGHHPEHILIDSDLDWGQDTKRLTQVLREKKVPFVRLSLLYSGDDSKLDLPAWDGLEPFKPTTGWIAISYFNRITLSRVIARQMGRPGGAYDWLDQYQPVQLVGKSILLYHIPETPKP